MKYVIQFLTGSLSGRVFELKPDSALTIGRSTSMQVQLEEVDVSGRHVAITLESYGSNVVLEVFSSRHTTVNGRDCKMNDTVELQPNDVVQLGRDVQFKLLGMQESQPADDIVVPDDAPTMGVGVAQSGAYVQGISQNAKTLNQPVGQSLSQQVVARGKSVVQDNANTVIGHKNKGSTDPNGVTRNVQSSQVPKINISPSAPSFNPPLAQSAQRQVGLPSQRGISSAPAQNRDAVAPQVVSQPSKGNLNKSQIAPDVTQAVRTRMASSEEIDALKKAFHSQQRLRLILWVVCTAGFFISMVFLYMFLRPPREDFVTWPTDSSGKEAIEILQTAPYLATIFPKANGMKVQHDGGNAEIYTRIGKRQDVMLHVLVSTWKNKEELKLDRSQAFERWIASTRQKHPDMNFNGTGRVVFINVSQGAGVPITMESYTRRVGNDDFFGVVGYLRHGENVHLTMVEVPLIEQWRAEPLLRERLCNAFIIYAIRLTPDWWEGTSRLREGTSIAEDLEEAGHYMRREAPAFWEKIHYLTKSALVKAALENKEEEQAKALDLLRSLRAAQSSWYNTQKLAYQYAQKSEAKDTMHSIQSVCESIFSSEFKEDDYRYDYIRRKEWQ